MADRIEDIEAAARLLNQGARDEAAAICQRILARDSRSVAALDLLGSIAHARGDHVAALEFWSRAVECERNSPLLRLRRGLALRAVGRNEDAVDEFGKAVELQPDSAEAHHQLGNALKAIGRFAEAVKSLTEATRLAPENAVAWLNLGVAYLESDLLAEAVRSFERALQLEPARVEGYNVLGVALLQMGKVSEAQQALAQALQLRPDYAAAHDNLARVYKAQGRMSEAIAEYRAALTRAPDPATHSNYLYALNFVPDTSPEAIFAEHRRWADFHAAGGRKLWKPHANRFLADRRLRVGFVSPDFINHAVAYFFEPVLLARDRSAIEGTCYSDATLPDSVTQRLRSSSDRWRDSARMSDEALANQIREDEIDVLVDLAGHTAHNRLAMFARKPAPIQVTWLGYPNTTGLSAIDYRITDDVSDPSGNERWHTEKLLRLSDGFLCYKPPLGSPPVQPSPAATRGFVTFGSFSNFAKVSDPCLVAWARVLNAVSNSRLVLKSRGLGDPETIARLHARLHMFGVAPDRIDLDGRVLSVADHLALYGGVDIALDPFPYNGTTTTCEALWMGVPVITLAGRTHVQRVGASLLTHLGRPDWVATSPQDYVTRCIALASDVAELARNRASLRDRFSQSAICDAARFMRNFEGALRQVWRARCTVAGT